MNWISVKDRLPESGQEVLIYDSHANIIGQGNKILQCEWYRTTYVNGNSRCGEPIATVTHWMPLPDKPNKK